ASRLATFPSGRRLDGPEQYSQSSQNSVVAARARRRFGLARDFLDPFSLIRTCRAVAKTVSSNVSRNCATATARDGRAAPLQLFYPAGLLMASPLTLSPSCRT